MFATAELFSGDGLTSVAGKLISAKAFPGDDRPRAEKVGNAFKDGARSLRFGDVGMAGFEEHEVWPTHRARIGLRVEPPVLCILVFVEAIVAHREFPHGGQRAVVGNVEDDAVTRAAVGAIGEGIVVAAIRGVAGVGEAGIANADIRRNEGEGGTGCIAFMNRKSGVACDRDFGADDLGDADERRSFDGEGGNERVNRTGVALNLDKDTAGRVKNESGESVSAGEFIDVRTEADALHHAANL